MSKTKSASTSNCLVEAFQKRAREYRRDCNATAAKSMTLTFFLVSMLLVAVLVRFFIS
jgi:hypothetical protein